MISVHTTFSLADFVQGTESDGEVVVLDLASEKFFGLNETGSRLWQELSQGRTLEQALATLESEFEVAPELLHADATRLVQDWIARGWLLATPQVLA